MDDRSSKITLGGEEYELLFTTRAAKEISKRFGGLDKLGDALQSLPTDEQLELTVWLIVVLANQAIMIRNLKNRENKKELLTVEYVELISFPDELAGCTDAVFEAVNKGMNRSVKSEDDSKNAEVG